MNVLKVIEKYKISCTFNLETSNPFNPEMPENSHHYTVKITLIDNGKKRTYTTPYSEYPEYTDPKPQHVLEALVHDYKIIKETTDFKSFCSYLEIKDKKKGRQLYNLLKRLSVKLEKFLSGINIEELEF